MSFFCKVSNGFVKKQVWKHFLYEPAGLFDELV